MSTHPTDPSQPPGVVPDLVHEEEALLAEVRALLHATPYDVPPSEKELVEELVRLRDEIHRAKEEDKGSILAQYNQQLTVLEQIRSSRDRAQVDPDSPYFAHMRLEEDGEERDVYLGKATRLDGGLRIVDWRHAPVSRLFYTYQQGDLYEERLGDRVREGEIVARRTLTIERGDLHRVDAPEGTFLKGEDGIWSAREAGVPRLLGGAGSATPALHDARTTAVDRRLGSDRSGRAHRVDKRLPDIAGLIDPDQFDLITRDPKGFLVIRGTAGSGKTTVALHRIAWLAYQDATFDSEDTRFLVFSKALRDYVSRVLPALGVGRAKVQTFPEWAATLRRQHFKMLPRRHRDDTPEAVVRLKTHPATMVALERHITSHSGPRTAEQAVDDWISVLSRPDALRPVLNELAPGALSDAQLRSATTWCRDRFDALLTRMEGGEVEEELALDAEDDALLLRAWQLRVGPLRERNRPIAYKHVAIDEVQDFSPVEVRVLIDCLDAKRSLTLSGDTQQHVMQASGFTSWTTFFGWLGVEGAAVDTLRVAYRSAAPIVRFAQAVLGELAEDDTPPLTVRDGPPVEVFRFTDHGHCVAFLADVLERLGREEPLASCAVIVPDRGLAGLYHQGLERARVPRLHRVTDEDFRFMPGVEIVEASQVKGLEFDYVVIVEASAGSYPDTPSFRRLLHVAATRAIHQLWITSVGTLSPMVREGMG